MAWRTTASNTAAAAMVPAGVAAAVSIFPPTTLLQLPPPPILPKHHRLSLTIPSPTDSPPSSTTEERGKGSGKESERGKNPKITEASSAHVSGVARRVDGNSMAPCLPPVTQARLSLCHKAVQEHSHPQCLSSFKITALLQEGFVYLFNSLLASW